MKPYLDIVRLSLLSLLISIFILSKVGISLLSLLSKVSIYLLYLLKVVSFKERSSGGSFPVKP